MSYLKSQLKLVRIQTSLPVGGKTYPKRVGDQASSPTSGKICLKRAGDLTFAPKYLQTQKSP